MNVTEILQNGPEMIRQREDVVEAFRKTLDEAEHRLDVAKALAALKYEGAKNQKLLEAAVTTDKDVLEAEAKVIQAKGQYKSAEIALREAENQFTSARKLGGMGNTIAEIRSTTDQR